MSDMRDRLRRLNELRNYRPPTLPAQPSGHIRLPASREPQRLESIATGILHETELGTSYIIPTRHEADHQHGGRPLSDWLSQDLAGAAQFTEDPRFATIDPRRCLFIDTETTGLGPMALAFLVGVGHFTDEGFEVRQFFLRDPSEEPAMLHTLHELLKTYDALVTFNGRSFDVPLLTSRYTLNRQRVQLDRWANLDLLFPARKLWKRRLDSCRLANLEIEVLGVERTGDDVPGWLIPQLYQEYVLTQDASEISRVIYHNLIDILSMVTLGAQLCETFATPHEQRLPGQDWLSLAQWYVKLKRHEQAEAAFQAAFQAARFDSEMVDVLQRFTEFLKKMDRTTDAAPHWETWAALQPKSIDPRLELSKHHEWTTKNYALAVQWAEDALTVVKSWGVSQYREVTTVEIEHRLERLRRKTHV